MKKIFTLAIGSLFTLAVMAAGNKPSVTVKSSKNYQIVIDGKSYAGNSYIDLSGLYPGFHSVKVYDVKSRSFFRKKSNLIASSSFSLKNNSIIISVDRFGKIDIDEQRSFDKGDHGRGWNKKDVGQIKHKNGRSGKF